MTKTYRYKVTGSSHFPFDMLRYDSAWPTSNGVYALEEINSRPTPSGTVTVELCGLRYPTIGRWNSFGWLVSSAETI